MIKKEKQQSKILRCSYCKEVLDSSYDWLKGMSKEITEGLICNSCSTKNRAEKRTARILKEENKSRR